MAIITGKKYNVLQNDVWNVFSFFTKASDVTFDDGTNAEEKVQDIEEKLSNFSNIELDTTLSVEGKAADAKAVGDAINVRWNNESGYLEVYADGKWEPTGLNTGNNYQALFTPNNNAGEFTKYNGSVSVPTYTNYNLMSVNVGDKLTIIYNGSSVGIGGAIVVSKLYDLTNFKKIVFDWSCTFTGTSNYNSVKACAVKTLGNPCTFDGIIQFTASSGSQVTQELDISSLSGSYYIGIELCGGNGVTTATISDIHLE